MVCPTQFFRGWPRVSRMHELTGHDGGSGHATGSSGHGAGSGHATGSAHATGSGHGGGSAAGVNAAAAGQCLHHLLDGSESDCVEPSALVYVAGADVVIVVVVVAVVVAGTEASALVHVAGYNTSLGWALRRFGQLLALASLPAHIAPFVFSWPGD